MEEEIDKYYQIRAKEITDMLFDKGFFREDVSREGMNSVEDFLAWYLDSLCKTAVKVALLSKKIKDKK